MTFTFLPAQLGGRFGGRVDPSSDTISHPPPTKSVIRSVTARSRSRLGHRSVTARSRCAPGRRAPGRPAAASRPAGRSVRPPPSTGPAAVGGGARLGCTQSTQIISARPSESRSSPSGSGAAPAQGDSAHGPFTSSSSDSESRPGQARPGRERGPSVSLRDACVCARTCMYAHTRARVCARTCMHADARAGQALPGTK